MARVVLQARCRQPQDKRRTRSPEILAGSSAGGAAAPPRRGAAAPPRGAAAPPRGAGLHPGEPGSRGSPSGSRGNLGAGHVAVSAVPDLFTPATLAAFKSTLSPTCGRGERGEQVRHSRYGPENPAPSDLQWGSTPGESRLPAGSRDSGLRPEGSRPEFLGEPSFRVAMHVCLHLRIVQVLRAERREPTCAGGYMRVATVLLALALAAARPHDSASDRRALEALEARDQRAFELAIAPNRTRLQTIGKCSTIAAGGNPPPPPLPYPSSLQSSACAHSRVPRDVAAQHNDRHRCTDECESDFECADDEKCCMVGCMVCSKAHLGPRYTETGIAFVFFLLWAWFITCGLVGST